jgi:hypothetical protein
VRVSHHTTRDESVSTSRRTAGVAGSVTHNGTTADVSQNLTSPCPVLR